MSDEEKKAIKRIKSEQDINEFMPRLVFNCEDIEIVLNLIEKQQKEIEELKNIQQQICNEELLEQEYVKENFIRKDKIKAKIEEIKQYSKEHGYLNMRSEINVLQSLLEKE